MKPRQCNLNCVGFMDKGFLFNLYLVWMIQKVLWKSQYFSLRSVRVIVGTDFFLHRGLQPHFSIIYKLASVQLYKQCPSSRTAKNNRKRSINGSVIKDHAIKFNVKAIKKKFFDSPALPHLPKQLHKYPFVYDKKKKSDLRLKNEFVYKKFVSLKYESYRRHVVSLSKTLYSPKVLVNYPGSGGSVPIWLKNCWLGR